MSQGRVSGNLCCWLVELAFPDLEMGTPLRMESESESSREGVLLLFSRTCPAWSACHTVVPLDLNEMVL